MRGMRGMTLVELMVGLVIGLLAVLVITQVTTIWEGKKRTTTGGSDAQVNGALALQQLQRDIQMAGYGSVMGGSAGCWAKLKLGATAYPDYRLAPVVITDGASGAPDTLRVLLSNTENFAVPITTASDHLRSDALFTLQNNINIGNRTGDLMLAVPASGCTVGASPTIYASAFNISATPSGNTINHATGNTGPWNQDSTGTIFPGTATTDVSYAAGSFLINLGNLESSRGVPLYRDYSVAAQTLTAATFTARGSVAAAGAGTTVASASTVAEDQSTQIVNLQAVYGKDTSTPKDQVADAWTASAPTTQDDWTRIVAVRVAVVARSTQYEREIVTEAAPGDCTSLTAASTYPKWKPDGSTYDCLDISTVPDYQHYRYRVFEMVIPLRNMVWQS